MMRIIALIDEQDGLFRSRRTPEPHSALPIQSHPLRAVEVKKSGLTEQLTLNAFTKRRAFTLVELLVLIGLIVLLIGILLPTLSYAWRSSRQTACAATLRGIGAGWVIYAQADPSTLPIAVSFPTANPPPAGEITIMKALERQVPAPGAWRCPSDDREYFGRFGTAYEYWPGVLIALDPNNARVIAQYAKRHSAEVPILGDAEPFHPKPTDPLRKLALYHDGHVDDFKAP